MIFNGIEKEYLTVLRGRKRPAWAPVERDFITVQGMSGAHLARSKRQIRTITVPVFILADSFNDLQKVKEDMAEWLIHEEPKKLVFKDEPDRTYYALVDGSLDLDELVRWGEGEITFVCPDPYKYGKEKALSFPADTVVVESNGTAKADPIFELTAKEKTTFAMVTTGTDEDSEYNLIGTPVETTEKIIDTRELLLKEDGTTLNTWDASPKILDERFNKANGSLTGDATGIYASKYGSGADINHGGYLIKELPKSIQDFRLETHFDVDTPSNGETFRVEVYMIAEDMSILGKVGMLDGNVNLKKRVGLVRAGEYKSYGENYTHYSGNYSHDRVGSSQTWYLRFIREGNEIRTRVARRFRGEQVRGKNGRIMITDKDMLKKLRYIGVYIGYYGDTKKPRLARINHIDVFEMFKQEEDQTPYILYPGDKVTFNHKDEDILVNGEPRMDLKNFGGSFFRFDKGENLILVSPEDSFDTKVTFRDKYL